MFQVVAGVQSTASTPGEYRAWDQTSFGYLIGHEVLICVKINLMRSINCLGLL